MSTRYFRIFTELIENKHNEIVTARWTDGDAEVQWLA